MSMLLEENASVLKVNNTRGQTIFKRKSNNMSDLVESYIKQFIPMNESDKDDKIMQCIKSSQDRYDEYKLINAMISSYKELKDDERFMNVLINKIYNLATIVCNEIHPSEPNEDNKLEMPTYDSIVEELFGKEFVRKENENKKEVSGTEQLTEDASSEPSEENTDKTGETDDNKDAENEVDKNHEVKQGLGTGYATFVRKPTNLDSLSDKAKYFTEGESSYIIVKQLKVSNQEFDDICNNFSKTYDFCKEMEPLDNENYSYNVIKIVTDNKDFSLLVDPSGFDYCRYVAILGKLPEKEA